MVRCRRSIRQSRQPAFQIEAASRGPRMRIRRSNLFSVNLRQDWQFQDAQVREVKANGTTYLVAPVIALIEGVMNDWYITSNAIEQSAPNWNGVPLVINHPLDEMGPIPAEPRHQVGIFQYVRYRPD